MARGGRRGRKYTNRRVATELVAVSETIAPKPGGTNFEVQFSKAGEFSGSSGLTYDGDSLELTGTLSTQGNLGVNMSGSSPSHGVTLPDTSTSTGQVKANSFVTYSSIRFKKDVQKLDNAMDIINQLEGVSYKWKDTGKQDYGFIAEEVGRVLPDIVEWEDENNATSMDYMRIISFLVEAVKYQHNKLNELTDKIDNGL